MGAPWRLSAAAGKWGGAKGGGGRSGVEGLVAAPPRPRFTGDHANAQHSKELQQ